MSWQRGPVPKGTYNWGGVVLKDQEPSRYSGFYFADFAGDHVKMCPSGRRIELDEIAWYNNSLELPNTLIESAFPAEALPPTPGTGRLG